MRKLITFLMTLLVGSSVSYANADFGQLTFEVGYRHDDISWNQKAPSYNPNYKLHRKFKDLDIVQIGLKGRTMLGYNFYGRASVNWGWIVDGDYKRTFSTYKSPVIAGFGSEDFVVTDTRRDVIDENFVYDLSIGVGYPFYFSDCTLALSPVVGYALDSQHISVEQGGLGFDSTGAVNPNTYGSYTHKFNSRWYGPFVGVDFNYRPYGETWNLYAEVEYHFARFKGRYHDELLSQHHIHRSKHAHAWTFALGADYDFSNDWTAGLCVKFQDWTASRRHGHHGHVSSNSNDEIINISGNERTSHKWNSYAINLTFGKQF
ncbi:autotransporter outer membrane beta-barrel domain-containing protein [Candidatus Protochlamydia sp. W-9]|uniref:autotransporter outer membrane beta-barrel domain-containing protein n=1 Tax=Candidatus Protochlamydia sp. W-9 TaxID=1785087 RepID=UPI00096AA372|nr:autotransporter outer membrane beta-barrel domain-containing protein [Candidatus Protochlamydia sp. W-9]